MAWPQGGQLFIFVAPCMRGFVKLVVGCLLQSLVSLGGLALLTCEDFLYTLSLLAPFKRPGRETPRYRSHRP